VRSPQPSRHPDTDQIAKPLWEFCGRTWTDPHARELLLYWQDRHGADVLLVLLAAWYAGEWTDALGSALQTGALTWQKATVARIRPLRRRVKRLSWPEGYAALQQLELSAEKIEILWLAANSMAQPPSAGSDECAAEPTIRRMNPKTFHTICERLHYLYPDVALAEVRKLTSALLKSQHSC
jgi:uncharacterized protein (TIGR02444 family)